MKGESLIAPVSVAVFTGVFLMVGILVYSYVAGVAPHDIYQPRESIFTGGYTSGAAVSGEFDHYPINNDSTLACYVNVSGSPAAGILMTNGGGNVTNRFNVLTVGNNRLRYFNITHTGQVTETYNNVTCTYYEDAASVNQQNFWNDTTSSSYAAFILGMVIVIVLASVAVIGYIILLRG